MLTIWVISIMSKKTKITKEEFESLKPLLMEHAKSVAHSILTKGSGWSLSSLKPMEKFDNEYSQWVYEPIVIEGKWNQSYLSDEAWENLDIGMEFNQGGYCIQVYGYDRFLKSKSTIVLSYNIVGRVKL